MPHGRTRRNTTVVERVKLQHEADGRRAISFETVRERVTAVGDAYVAMRRTEEGADAAFRQSLVDLSSACLVLAELVPVTRPRRG